MTTLPDPPLPAEVDLTDFSFMPLDVRRLRDSRIAASATGEEFRAAVLLWCAAWHQKPAASIPDDEVELAQLAGFGRVIKEWRKVKAGALHGWVKCSDGRLYHPVVAEKAAEAWNEKRDHAWSRECDRIRKENKRRAQNGEEPLEFPPRPSRISAGGPVERTPRSIGIPPEQPEPSGGIPAENALKGQGQGQGQGQDIPESIDSGGGGAAPSLEAEVFRRGKALLGKSAGGQITKLRLACGRDDRAVLAILDEAEGKADRAEWIAGVIRRRAAASATDELGLPLRPAYTAEMIDEEYRRMGVEGF